MADDDRVETFMKLLGQNQRRIFLYLLSLTQDRQVVEDVMQETNLVLWREYDSFQPGTNFAAWACTVAFNQVRAWRKKQRRDRLRFSDDFLQAMDRELQSSSHQVDQKLDALDRCLKKLPDHHQKLIHFRYRSGAEISDIAEKTNRSMEAVYRMLSRVRSALLECITTSLATGETR